MSILDYFPSLISIKNIKQNDVYEAMEKGDVNFVRRLISKGFNIDESLNKLEGSLDFFKLGGTFLHLAAQLGKLNIVEFLIKSGAEINKKDKHSRTPLFIAAQNGYLEIVKYLYSKGADVNITDIKWENALKVAQMNGHAEVVTFLGQKTRIAKSFSNRKMTYKEEDFKNTLINNEVEEIDLSHHSISYEELFKLLKSAKLSWRLKKVIFPKEFRESDIKSKFDDVAKRNKDLSEIYNAIVNSDIESVRNLNKFSIKYCEMDDEITSPLSMAISIGNQEIVALLLAKVTDFSLEEKDYLSAFKLALEKENQTIFMILADKAAREDKFNDSKQYLDTAINKKLVEVVEYLLINHKQALDARSLAKIIELGIEHKNKRILEKLNEQGFSISSPDSNGETPLYKAIRDGDIESAKLLIELNAKIADKEKDILSIIQAAVEYRQFEIITFLKACGEDIDLKDNESRTPLCKAIQVGDLPAVKYFLGMEAKVNEISKNLRDLFSIAIEYNQKDVITYLLEMGISLDLKNNKGLSPLQEAVKNYPLNSVATLIESGANINCQDDNNSSLLHLAVERGDLNLIKLLIENGIEINTTDKQLRTPLHLATQMDDKEIINVLKRYGGCVNQDAIAEYLSIPHHGGGQLRSEQSLSSTKASDNIRIKQYYRTPAWNELLLQIKNNTPDFEELDLSFNSIDDKGIFELSHALENNHTITKLNLRNNNIRDTGGIRLSYIADVNRNLTQIDISGNLVENAISTKIYSFLLRNRKNVASSSRLNWTIARALSLDDYAGIKKMIDTGIDINHVYSDGQTLLHRACEHGCLEITKYLLKNGANLTDKTTHGKTAVQLARESRNDKLLEYLENFKRPPSKDFTPSKKNFVLIRMWSPTYKGKVISYPEALAKARAGIPETNVGHLSLYLRFGDIEEYMSHWPSPGGHYKNVPVRSANYSLAQDIEKEGEPHTYVVLYTLDFAGMLKELRKIQDKDWVLINHNGNEQSASKKAYNCSDSVYSSLEAGGFFVYLLNEHDKIKSYTTPMGVAELANKASKVEKILYPVVDTFLKEIIENDLLEKAKKGSGIFNQFKLQNPDYISLYKKTC